MVEKKEKSKVAGSLSGMQAIADYVNRSESTVLKLIRDADFPAKKIGGVWEAKKTKVDVWYEEMVSML